MTSQADIDPGSATVKFNGRLTGTKEEGTHRSNLVVVRFFIEQGHFGDAKRILLPIVEKEMADKFLESVTADAKTGDFLEIDGHIWESNERSVIVMTDNIVVVEEIDEERSSFRVTGPLTKRTKQKLKARNGYDSTSVFDLQVSGVDLKVFDSDAQAELKEIKKGAWVIAHGYVKCYVKGESLRSVLYVERIEEIEAPSTSDESSGAE
jgi:hypothetical protein